MGENKEKLYPKVLQRNTQKLQSQKEIEPAKKKRGRGGGEKHLKTASGERTRGELIGNFTFPRPKKQSKLYKIGQNMPVSGLNGGPENGSKKDRRDRPSKSRSN